MSVEILKRAAKRLREDWDNVLDRRVFPTLNAYNMAQADWLDVAGADLWAHGIPDGCDSCGGCTTCDDDPWAPHIRAALKVARAYLGEDA